MAVAAGCASPASQLRVDQPGTSGRQREMHLVSDWSYFALGDQRDRYLLLFPLPGATGGDEQFALYLRAAKGRGPRGAGVLLPEAPRFDGFFIQMRGERKGLTNLMSGLMEVKGVALTGERRRRIELQAQCEDGTILNGTCLVSEERFRVRDFEDRRAADVAALDGQAP